MQKCELVHYRNVYGIVGILIKYGKTMCSYKESIRFGPTYRFIHKECGRKAKKINLKHSHMYVCEHCDESMSKHLAAYTIDKVRVA